MSSKTTKVKSAPPARRIITDEELKLSDDEEDSNEQSKKAVAFKKKEATEKYKKHLERSIDLAYAIGNKNTVAFDAETYSKKSLLDIKNVLKREVHDLIQVHSQKRKKGGKDSNSHNGLFNPKIVNTSLIKFANDFDLGHAYDDEGNDLGKLQRHIPLLIEKGITNNALLTALFCNFVYYHDIQHSQNKQMIEPPQEFIELFEKEFEILVKKTKDNLIEKEDKFHAVDHNDKEALRKCKKEVLKAREGIVDPHKFKYAKIPTLIAICTVTEDRYKSGQKEMVTDPETRKQLQKERMIMTSTRKYQKAEFRKRHENDKVTKPKTKKAGEESE